jgi:tetratricopeptide (TPR) repeat protein
MITVLGLLLCSFLLFPGWIQEPGPLHPGLQNGIALAQQGRLEEAESQFDSVPPSDPGYWQAQYFSAVAKAQLKKADAARAILVKIVEKFPDNRDAHYLLGMLSEDARDLKQAEANFRKVTTLAPEDARGWAALGRVLQAEGKAEEALKALQEADKLGPGDPGVRLLLGEQHYLMAHYKEALDCLLPAWQADSSDATLASEVAGCYVALKDSRNLDALMESLPRSIVPEVEMAVGLAYIRNGDESLGFTYMVQGAAARPGDFKTQRILADAMFRSMLFVDAQRVYQDCLKIKPDDPETTFLLGRSMYEDRKIDQACDLYQKVVRLRPDFAAGWFHLGICNRALEQTDEAREDFLKALVLEPRNPETFYNLGMVSLKNGEAEKAEDYFRKALALAPGHAPAHYELGRVLISQNKLEDGLVQIDLTIKANPNHTQAHYQRGMILKRLGRAEESKQEFDIFQKLEKEDRERRKVIDRKVLAPATRP